MDLALLRQPGVGEARLGGDQGGAARQGRRDDEILFSHTNFTYLVETNDREKALVAQKPMFDAVMGRTGRSSTCRSRTSSARSTISSRGSDLESAGCQYVVLGPTSDDLGQLDLIAKHLIPEFS